MTDEKVLAFPARGDLPVCPVEIVRGRDFGWCNHDKIRLNEHDRCVLCADCGATLDAFDYLKKGAMAIRRGWEDYRSMMQRVEELQGRIAALQKEQRRLAGSVKRAKAKAEDGVIEVRKPL